MQFSHSSNYDEIDSFRFAIFHSIKKHTKNYLKRFSTSSRLQASRGRFFPFSTVSCFDCNRLHYEQKKNFSSLVIVLLTTQSSLVLVATTSYSTPKGDRFPLDFDVLATVESFNSICLVRKLMGGRKN
jgi:hypothetical protein